MNNKKGEDTPEIGRISAEYPAGRCVHQIFEREVERSPERIALVHGQGKISYAELNVRANRIANHLMSLGVGPGTLVGLMMERSPDLIVSILGILKAGCAYVPLDPEYPQERLVMMLEDSNPPVLLTQSSLLRRLRVEGIECICIDKLELGTENPDNPDLNTEAESLAYVMFTSGSTGRPKGVMIEHRSIVRLVRGADYANFSAENVFLQFAPITFDASTFEIWGALLNGARLAIMPAGVPSLADLGTAIREYGVTTLWLTAGLFHLMVDERIDDLKPLRQLLAGGDVLSVTHVQKALSRLDCDLINGYGPTENTTFTCCYKVPRGVLRDTTIPIGKPISNTQVYILNADLKPVHEGEIGELFIGGEGLARGYFNRDDLTAERFITVPFTDGISLRLYRTGDFVRSLPDGNIEFLGRADNQIKIRGFRIELEEVELALGRCSGVLQAIAVAKDTPKGNKQLVAFVVPDRNVKPELCGLKKQLEQVLPEYMVPSVILQLDALPLTPNGKVDRAALIGTTIVEPERRPSSAAPDTDIEKLISGMLEEVLDKSPIGTDENFFDLGANSLQLASLHSRLQATIKQDLRIIELFQNPTVRALARSFDRNESGENHTSRSQNRGLRQRAAYTRHRRKQLEEAGS